MPKMRIRINAALNDSTFFVLCSWYLFFVFSKAPSTKHKAQRRPSLFRASTSRSVQGGNLLADDRVIRSFVYVDLGPMSVVLRHISIGKNCFHGTLRHARIAIDASVGIDVKTIRQLMKSFNRTNSCAVGVLAIHA